MTTHGLNGKWHIYDDDPLTYFTWKITTTCLHILNTSCIRKLEYLQYPCRIFLSRDIPKLNFFNKGLKKNKNKFKLKFCCFLFQIQFNRVTYNKICFVHKHRSLTEPWYLLLRSRISHVNARTDENGSGLSILINELAFCLPWSFCSVGIKEMNNKKKTGKKSKRKK